MRIELRDEHRRRIGRIEADPALRPTRVTVMAATHTAPRGADAAMAGGAAPSGQREVFLNWDTAVDDAGQLRRCVACGCGDLFREKVFPQVTGMVVLMAFVGAVIGLMGQVTPTLLGLMLFVLALDVGILLVSRQRLVCYQCRSAYSGLAIARYHRRWDRTIADRYAAASARAPAPAAGQPPATQPAVTITPTSATRQGFLT